jgi:hypothetical protein
MGKRSRNRRQVTLVKETGKFYPSEAPYFIPNLIEVNVAHSLVFYVMFYWSLFVLFHLAYILSADPKHNDSHFLFGIFKLFLVWIPSQQ